MGQPGATFGGCRPDKGITMTEQYTIDLARPTLTVPETAGVLDIGLNATYDAIKRGDIPSIRIGKSIRVPTAALRAMLGILPSTSKVA